MNNKRRELDGVWRDMCRVQVDLGWSYLKNAKTSLVQIKFDRAASPENHSRKSPNYLVCYIELFTPKTGTKPKIKISAQENWNCKKIWKKNLKTDREEGDRRSRFIFINLFSPLWVSSHAPTTNIIFGFSKTSAEHQIVELFLVRSLRLFSFLAIDKRISGLCSANSWNNRSARRGSEIMQKRWYRRGALNQFNFMLRTITPIDSRA